MAGLSQNNIALPCTTPVDQASNEIGQGTPLVQVGLPATHADVVTMLHDFGNEVWNLVPVQTMTQ